MSPAHDPEDKAAADPDAPSPAVRRSLRYRVVHSVITVFAAIGGAVVGFMVTLALVVLEARFKSYIFAMEDLMAFRWDLIPIPLGAWAGYRLHHRRSHGVGWATLCGLAGLVVCGVAGTVIGSIVWSDSAAPWAGAVIGGAVGLVAGCVASLRIRRTPRSPLITASAGVVALLGLFLFGVFGATNLLDISPLEFPEATPVPVPEPSKVDAVVFLLGDAGATMKNRTPLLPAIQAEIEQWSAALRRDSAVSILFLGDNVYPQGVHDRGEPGFEADSMSLWSQIDLVAGPEALKHGTVGLFVTGNHDWSNTVGEAGLHRVQNLENRSPKAARPAGTSPCCPLPAIRGR